MVVIYAVMFYSDRDAVECGLAKLFVWDRELMWRLLRYGTPGALPMMIEAMAFSTVTFCVTGLGHVEGAATGLAFNVNAVAFIPVVGLSIATATLVGQHLGENRSDLAAKSTWTRWGLPPWCTRCFCCCMC
ncbi:MAG: MATE family efflux transporter [Pirellulales bacterium]